MIFFRKFQFLTQALGVLCLFGLAGYGLWTVVSHSSIAWAMPTNAVSSAPPASVELIPSSQTAPTVPALLNYQGELKDNNGNPLTGAYNMTFRIYDSVSAGTALWTETQNNVTVRNGVFSVLLGGTTALPVALFTAPDRFIGVTVSPYAEMAPRQRLSSVPYAIWSHQAYYAQGAGYATNSDTLDGLDNTAFSRAGHVHDDRYYTAGALQSAGAAPVTWSNLFNIPPGFADGTDNIGLNGALTVQEQTIDGGWCGVTTYQLRFCIDNTCSNWLTHRTSQNDCGGGG